MLSHHCVVPNLVVKALYLAQAIHVYITLQSFWQLLKSQVCKSPLPACQWVSWWHSRSWSRCTCAPSSARPASSAAPWFGSAQSPAPEVILIILFCTKAMNRVIMRTIDTAWFFISLHFYFHPTLTLTSQFVLWGLWIPFGSSSFHFYSHPTLTVTSWDDRYRLVLPLHLDEVLVFLNNFLLPSVHLLNESWHKKPPE